MKVYAIEVSDDGIYYDILSFRFDELSAFQFYQYCAQIGQYKYYRIAIFTYTGLLVSDR